MKTIVSRDNPTFKALRLLADDAREIRRQARTLIDGPHLLRAYLASGGHPERVMVSEAGMEHPEVADLAARFAPAEMLVLRDTLFAELSGVANPVGILALIEVPQATEVSYSGDCLLLDGIQDAGNVGTLLRTAAAAGVQDVVLGIGCAGAWTPRVLRAAQGAHFQLRICEHADLKQILAKCGGRSIATVAHGGVSLFATKLTAPAAWLFGSEGNGVAADLVEQADRRITIPLTAGSESLNVAAAAAICLFEARRQRTEAAA